MDNRKLGWIAIGLGVVALLVALGGRVHPMGWYNEGPRFGYGPPAAAPRGAGPRQQAGPQGPAQQNPGPQQAGPQGPTQQGPGPQQAGPRGRFGNQQGFGGPREVGGPHGFGGPRGFGRFLFFPFMLIGGLFRLALFVLVIALLARWFFRRRYNQAPPPPPPAAGPSGPGPEQPPYTGGTQAL